MIQVVGKENCCGCEACVQSCPVHCITMNEDNEGFLYPKVDEAKCLSCGLCNKSCPMLNNHVSIKPKTIYAGYNKDEQIRMDSSSGGFFTILAQVVLSNGGVVYGAMFDNNWMVVHGKIETMDDLYKIRKSKYVQSRIENCFKEIEQLLKKGTPVMFSGCPCQVAGLKSYLKKEYQLLFLVDFVCHGVPSPGIWNLYLKEFVENARKGENSVSSHSKPPISERDTLNETNDVKIEGISFRDKQLGWEKFSFALTLAKASADGKKNTVSLSNIYINNPYMKGFIRNIILRPSCYSCKFKNFRSGADITLADFWGVRKEFPDWNDDKGIGVAFINSDKELFPYNKAVLRPVSLEQVLKYNPAIAKPSKLRRNRKLFYSYFNENDNISLTFALEKYSAWDIREQIRNLTITILVNCGLIDIAKKILNKS